MGLKFSFEDINQREKEFIEKDRLEIFFIDWWLFDGALE